MRQTGVNKSRQHRSSRTVTDEWRVRARAPFMQSIYWPNRVLWQIESEICCVFDSLSSSSIWIAWKVFLYKFKRCCAQDFSLHWWTNEKESKPNVNKKEDIWFSHFNQNKSIWKENKHFRLNFIKKLNY